jgi:capsular polysaccharide biosynthesis protein
LQNLALGAFGGLILGLGIALFKEIFIRRVHSGDDLISEVGIPLLGHLRKSQI